MVIQGGANLVRHPPAFANDGKRLLVCTASAVTVFSVATALPVLQLNGHTDVVTSVSVVPAPGTGAPIAHHVWTSSLDGSIRLWDFGIGNLIRTVTVGKPIESMVIPSLQKVAVKSGTKTHDNIAFISVRWDKENHQASGEGSWTGRVILFNLSTGKPLRGVLAKTLLPQRLVVSPLGSFVGMPDSRRLWVWSVPGGTIEGVKKVKNLILHHTKACRVLAFDPSETMLAGGDETGRLLCWHNIGQRTFSPNASKDNATLSKDDGVKGGVRGEDDAEACTTHHWHASEVKSLLYSVDGTYLFSGGSEGTLVIWQPETGKQQYLPRLGGHLSFITPSPDPSVFAVSCSDNAIRFVNIGSMSVEKSCQGIKPVVSFPKILKSVNNTRVAFSPQGGKLVLPTDNVALQFYDVLRDHELFEVQVAQRTNVFGANNNTKSGGSGPSNFVTHVTFSRSGSVMVTVDVLLPEENVGGGSCLKFWNHEPGKQEYLLNTLVDEPHSAEITALVYHPFEHFLVSCSLDATFKVWVTGASVEMQENTGKVSAWRCRSVGSYRHKEILSAAFSPDGSLLAISAEELVTLWNPYSNGFVSSLAGVPSPQRITVLAFVHNSKCLVAASSGFRPRLIVWHLPTLSVLWSCYVHVEALSVDPKSSHFGIIALAASAEKDKLRKGDAGSRKAVVALFTPDNPCPTVTWSIQEGDGGTLFFGSSNLLSSSVVEATDAKQETDAPQSCMIVVTGSREYVVLNPYCPEDDTQTILPVATPLIEATPSAYLAMYGKSSTPLKKESARDVVGIRATRPWGDLFNAPSHVLPSLTKLSLTFMESLLEKQSDSEKLLLPVRESESLAMS